MFKNSILKPWHKSCCLTNDVLRPERDLDPREEMNSMTGCGASFLNRKKVNSKSRKFSFHHEITMDGVAVSKLFSRQKPPNPKTLISRKDETPWHLWMDINPGKKNFVTMTDSPAIHLQAADVQESID